MLAAARLVGPAASVSHQMIATHAADGERTHSEVSAVIITTPVARETQLTLAWTATT